METLKILLVEDDHVQAEEIREDLEEALSNVEYKIEMIDSEQGFYNRLDTIEVDAPDLIIMDVMLRWAHPSPEIAAPAEVIVGKHYRAGFRCLKRLAERQTARRINVILYTVLQKRDDIENEVRALPPNVVYLVKEPNHSPFIRTVRSLLVNP
ncbi:MAG: hypothetical protein M3416_00805 [Acidobacteriota bacterium]|nr:hypothetical protein [Acidobacteriota bacterium]